MSENFQAPQSRIEAILQNMLGAKNELPPPFSNNERILLNILGRTDIEILPIQSRIENLLMNWLGESNSFLNPFSNNERILLNILGEEGIDILPAQSRIEDLLTKIFNQGYVFPSNYTRFDYIQNSANTKVNTGIYPEDNTEIFIRDKVNSRYNPSSFYIFQSRARSSGYPLIGITGSSSSASIVLSINESELATSDIIRQRGHDYNIYGSWTDGTITLKVKDETTDEEAENTGSYSEFPTLDSPYYIFGNQYNSMQVGERVYEAWLKVNGEYKLHYIPAQNSDNEAGFYDTVTKTFITQSEGTLTAGNDVSASAGLSLSRNMDDFDLSIEKDEVLNDGSEEWT